MKLEHGDWVVIADGEKHLLLRNIGDPDFIHLKVVDHETSPNPPARELGADRPGRRPDATARGSEPGQAYARSAMEQTDWHRVAETRFAESTAETLRALAADGRFSRLVVVADPRTLGALRGAFDDALRATIVAEIAKDLTKLPVDRIEAAIAAHDAD